MDLEYWKKFVLGMFPKSSLFASIIARVFTKFVYSIGGVPKAIHDHVSYLFLELIPEHTSKLLGWSQQFNHARALSVMRLEAEWQQEGGQSPNYLQEQLHAAGHTSAYVHEWWIPLSDPVTARNPIPLINNYQPNNLLVNPIEYVREITPQCGDNIQCGDDVQCGDSNGYVFMEKIYPHPGIEDEYPNYFYVCGQTWGDPLAVTLEELADIKRIIYKIKPMHLRCVLLTTTDVWVNTPTTGDEIWVNTPTTGDEIYSNLTGS